MGGFVHPAAVKALAEAAMRHQDRPAAQIAAFWARVAPANDTGCRLWTGALQAAGYGAIRLGGKTVSTHRLAYSLICGPIPASMFVCHRCDVRACCNPTHLFLGSAADNNADALAKGRKVQMCGEAAGGSKLSESDVRAIREQSHIGPREMGRRFGVTHTTIRSVRSRKLWAHIR